MGKSRRRRVAGGASRDKHVVRRPSRWPVIAISVLTAVSIIGLGVASLLVSGNIPH
jgi:hypothetical protein